MRNHKDWLAAYLDYASFSEAPRRMHFWSGVSAIAGALRRRVWIDQAYFKWYPNLYIIFVAPPGIVNKSTTTGIAMEMLREVPGVRFGPDSITWQALITAFSQATEGFEHEGNLIPMSALTFEASEFGNLLNPQDKEMVDLLVSLWDGRERFSKITKHSGNDEIQNPWINLIAGTTPSWIAGSFPEYMIGGGFTSRCIFVYADKKAQFVAYPGLVVPKNIKEKRQSLIEDLTQISMLAGEYKLSPAAVEFGQAWYQEHYTKQNITLGGDERFGGYLARKQTLAHKVAMTLAAATSDELVITEKHLQISIAMLTELEDNMKMVFNKIGKSENSVYADKLIAMIAAQPEQKLEFHAAYHLVHSYFPSMREFDDVMAGLIKAKYLKLYQKDNKVWVAIGEQRR